MLTGFQLRAARAVLDLFNKDLGEKIGLNYDTIVRLEAKTQNLSYLKCNLRTSVLLANFFESERIIFRNKSSISIKSDTNIFDEILCESKITRFQLKASRIGMRLTQKELGEHIKLHQCIISDLENKNKNYEFLKYDENVIKIIKSFFIKNGIAFPDYYTVTLIDDPVILLNK